MNTVVLAESPRRIDGERTDLSEYSDALKECLKRLSRLPHKDAWDELDTRRYARCFANLTFGELRQVIEGVEETFKWRPSIAEVMDAANAVRERRAGNAPAGSNAGESGNYRVITVPDRKMIAGRTAEWARNEARQSVGELAKKMGVTIPFDRHERERDTGKYVAESAAEVAAFEARREKLRRQYEELKGQENGETNG